MATDNNFDETLRAIDSMQLTVKHKVAAEIHPNSWDFVEPYLLRLSSRTRSSASTFPSLIYQALIQSLMLLRTPLNIL